MGTLIHFQLPSSHPTPFSAGATPIDSIYDITEADKTFSKTISISLVCRISYEMTANITALFIQGICIKLQEK